MRKILVVGGVAIMVAAMLTVFAGTPAAAEKQREFVGAGKCKICHKTEAQGQQYPIWEKTAHANAYATLATDEAKAVAKEKGIDDPQKAAECLQCHVTGYGVAAEFLGSKYDMTEGVTCESCHGPGGDYIKKSVMKAVTAGTTEPASVGLVMPTEKVCVTCHNEKSPSYKGFNFDEMVKKIAHPMPEARREAAKASGGNDE